MNEPLSILEHIALRLCGVLLARAILVWADYLSLDKLPILIAIFIIYVFLNIFATAKKPQSAHALSL